MENFDRIILIDKPAGISSFGVVAKIRWQLTEEKFAQMQKLQPNVSRKSCRVKVGHTGTLDPFATGLMILLSGKFTRRAGEFSKLDKVYEAEIVLGATSTTGDPEGEITAQTAAKPPPRAAVAEIIKKFTGKITQTPPIFSAVKVGGERAYKLARRGETPAMPPRQVEIYSLEILDYAWPTLRLRAHVSSGTYIRTLAADIGRALGTGAYVKTLRRTKVGDFRVADALPLPLSDFAKKC